MDYLPTHASIEQACAWLHAKTGQTWILARLLEVGLMPWFWVDYSTTVPPKVFCGRVEGYLAPMAFAGDTSRLQADGPDALVNITRDAEGFAMTVKPAMRVALSELRFRLEDLEKVASDSGDRNANAEEQKAHRLAANCYSIYEAAEAIAKELGLTKDEEEKLRDDMAQAAFDGKLTVRSPRGHDQYAPTNPPETTYSYYYLTTPDDVNEWAKSRRFVWSWNETKPTAVPGMAPTPEAASGEFDYSMLATREQLIDAFGHFVGMDMSWFDKIDDTPKLKAARKVKGQGGGGRIVEPLFCPYEVMQWLMSPTNRKLAAPLGEITAWRQLGKDFPKVYAAREIGDPTQD